MRATSNMTYDPQYCQNNYDQCIRDGKSETLCGDELYACRYFNCDSMNSQCNCICLDEWNKCQDKSKNEDDERKCKIIGESCVQKCKR